MVIKAALASHPESLPAGATAVSVEPAKRRENSPQRQASQGGGRSSLYLDSTKVIRDVCGEMTCSTTHPPG